MFLNKPSAYRLSFLAFIVFAAISLAACYSGEAVTTTVHQDFESLWSIDIGLDAFEIVFAKHELVWKNHAAKLTVCKSPVSLSSVFVNGYQAKTEKGRTYYFREMQIAYDGTKSPDSKGFDMQGTIPYGREMQWETSKYLYSIQAESLNSYNSSLNEKLVSIRTSRLIEENFYHAFSEFTLETNVWRVDLSRHDAEMKICLFPGAFGEPLYKDFVADPTVTLYMRENVSYYQKSDCYESSDSKWMILIWKTDKGIFQLSVVSRNGQDTDLFSSFDMDFIKHVSAQIDAQPVISD